MIRSRATTGSRKTYGSLLLTFLATALLLALAAPAAAPAAWRSTEAQVMSAGGYVNLLNVRVVNHAENDAAVVTEVQFSDDGVEWYAMPYTGRAVDWVLAGESGRKTLSVRFVAFDGAVSPVVKTSVTVDTQGPRTKAKRAVRAAAGRAARFRFVVRDAISPRVRARLVVRGGGISRSYSLGTITTGKHTVGIALRLPKGSYRWSVRAVDMAGWAQTASASQALIVR